MHHQRTALLLLLLVLGLECATADESDDPNGDVYAGDVSLQNPPIPPYDVFRSMPSPLYPVYQLDPELPRDGTIDFDKLPRRHDGLPYVVRLMWGTCVTPGKSPPSFSCIWSDGTVTHRMPRTEAPYRRASPSLSPQSYELRYILKPNARTGG